MENITLINRNNETANIQLQDVIIRAVVNIGDIEEVILEEVFECENTGDNMLPVYYESVDENGDTIEEFLFNVNLSTYHVE